MRGIRLGVNIDHVATVRNARGETYPSPLRAALLAEKNGADSVTIHLREDRRHINEFDLKKIIKKLKIPLNLEIASTKEMLKIAYRSRPPFICIVPEKRKEITTEGGLNLDHNKKFLRTLIKKLKKHESPSSKSEVCLYIENFWYLLEVKTNAIKKDIKSNLNSQIVSDLIFKEILNIKNLSSNTNIEYIKGNQEIEILSKKVDQNKNSLGIELYPHKIEEITSIADIGENMPPKSTWIEPKLRSGLIIYEY